jgi:methyl-coenzyme M reductase subunit D
MDMEIFPDRLLGADTTEKLLDDIYDMRISMVIHGQRLPPANVKHLTREKSNVKGEKLIY